LHRDRRRAGIRPNSHAANEALSGARGFPSDVRCRFVLAQADVNCVAEQPVCSPRQIGDFGDELRLNPMDAGEDKRRAEASRARRQDVKRRRLVCERVEAAPQIGENLDGHPRANAAGIDELAVIAVVAKQKRPKIRPRAFRVRPADDNELLTVEPFGFAPQASVSRGVGRVDRFGDDALKTELASVLEDEFAVACVVTIKLKAELIHDQ
jgi:hypothetical protein